MKVVIGDMVFECRDLGEGDYNERAAGLKRLASFLEAAQACYIERYGAVPEPRYPKDEL